MKQWQCGQCGAWVPDGYWRHSHIETLRPYFEGYARMRAAAEAGLEGVTEDVFQQEAKVTNYMRTGAEPTRELPL